MVSYSIKYFTWINDGSWREAFMNVNERFNPKTWMCDISNIEEAKEAIQEILDIYTFGSQEQYDMVYSNDKTIACAKYFDKETKNGDGIQVWIEKQ